MASASGDTSFSANLTTGSSNFLKSVTAAPLASSGASEASKVCTNDASSRALSAAASNALKAASLAEANTPSTSTSEASLASVMAAASFASLVAGPASLVRWDTIPSASRGPPYSVAPSGLGSLPLKILMVGKPRTENFSARGLFSSSVASIFTSLMPVSPFSSSAAAFLYSGSSDLQWPHQGA